MRQIQERKPSNWPIHRWDNHHAPRMTAAMTCSGDKSTLGSLGKHCAAHSSVAIDQTLSHWSAGLADMQRCCFPVDLVQFHAATSNVESRQLAASSQTNDKRCNFF
jgi:hypothetical protein